MQDLLHGRRTALITTIQSSSGIVLHTDAWLLRVLTSIPVHSILSPERIVQITDHGDSSYEGYPRVAALGYVLGATAEKPPSISHLFIDGLYRLLQRSEQNPTPLPGDDVALLGIADGLERITVSGKHIGEEVRQWLLRLIDDRPQVKSEWTWRMRALAGDLLDKRGRLQVLPEQTSTDTLALEWTLRAVWPSAFSNVPLPEDKAATLLQSLLTETLPDEPERSAVWLRGLDLLVSNVCAVMTHSVSETVRILTSVQHAFKRWPYEDKPHRKSIAPIRWIIDDEYDVQAFLWFLLYPIYRENLIDETYLPNWGNVQPRADLGITHLKLIIEVKIARSLRDFVEIEEQVAGDIGLYFKDKRLFDHLIVFIYDDCDNHHPERHESLRHALKQREFVEEVIIVRRPGMLPNRNTRD